MNIIDELIFQYINENKSVKQICSLLNISEKQFYVKIRNLMNNGHLIKPIYSYDSDIYYTHINKLVTNNNVIITLPSKENNFKSLVISDLHIGNVKFNLDYIKRVYEYADRNDIHIIFICGDIIEGAYANAKLNINNVYDQTEYFINKYPYDGNIRNFAIFGNHDYHSIHYEGYDISKRITNKRCDIINMGYGKAFVNIREDKILLQHELSITKNPDLGEDPKVILVGHGHMMKTKLNSKFILCIPSLSDVNPDRSKTIIPGFVELSVTFNKKMIESVEAKHLILTPNVHEASISKCKIKCLMPNTNYNNKKR